MKSFNLTKEDFVSALRGVGYYVDDSLADLLYASLFTEPCGGAVLTGPPGVGKSAFPLSLAKALGWKIETFQVFAGMPDETLLVRHTVDKDGKVKASEGPLVKAAKLSNEGPTILLINEIDKARPSVDALFLDFLQDGYVNYLDTRVYANFPNLFVYITSNNNRPLEQALLRRLPLISLPPMSPHLLAELLRKDGFVQEEVGLAVKLYIAGLKTDLERPISYQELRQFLKALRLLPHANMVDLIRAYLIKSEEELEKYLRVVRSLPETIPWKEHSFSDEDLALKQSLASPMRVEVVEEPENSVAIPVAYPKVEVIRKKDLQIRVRSLDLEQLKVKGGYFLMNDYSLHVLNETGVPFVALEVGGENYLVLRKPLDFETATKLITALQRLDKPEKVAGEFLCRQDFPVSWEEFTSMFDLNSYLSLFSRHFRPYLLYKSGSGMRVAFKDEKDVELAEVLFYNMKGRAHVEVHVKAPNNKEVQKSWPDLSLYSLFEELKQRERKQEKELEDEKDVKLELRKERIENEDYLVVSTKNYVRALLGDSYKETYHDVLLHVSVLDRVRYEDTCIQVKVYLPRELEEGFNDFLVSLYEHFKEKNKETPFYKMSGSREYNLALMRLRFAYDFELKPSVLNLNASSGELESKMNELMELCLRTVLDEIVKPYLEHLKERDRTSRAIKNVNQKKEETLLRRLR